MKVKTLSLFILHETLALFFSPALAHGVSSSSLMGDKSDRDLEYHGVKLTVQDPFVSTRQGSSPVLRISGQHARSPAKAPGVDQRPKPTHLPDVSVTCSSTGFVVRVKKNFYGLSVEADELTLGETCKSNGVSPAHGDLLFAYALTDCQGDTQVISDDVVHKYVLRFVPLPHRRLHRLNVGVKCRFKRHDDVHSLVARPTFRKQLHKIISGRSGEFRIQLMDESWSAPVRSALYLLGQKVNVQVSTRHHNPAARLFIHSCHVTTVSASNQATKYSIIDNYGCLKESRKYPEVSRFRLSKVKDVLQFSFGAFQFIEAPEAQVTIHCELSVSAADPSPVQKSCFFKPESKRWISLSGRDSVCDCCDSVCSQTKAKRIIPEGFANTDRMVFSDPVRILQSTSASLTSDSTLSANRKDVVWTEGENSTDQTHVIPSSTAMSYSYLDDHKLQTTSHELSEERPAGEVEKHGDVEIVIAIRENFARSVNTDINIPLKDKRAGQQAELSHSAWFEDHHNPMNTEHFQKDEAINAPLPHKTISKKRDWTLGIEEGFFPAHIAEEEVDEGEKEPLDFLTFAQSGAEFTGSGDLLEHGDITKLDAKREFDYYYSK